MAIKLTIGKLAEQAGVSVETIRYYQRMQLLNEPIKPLQGYRIYPESDIARLRFIKRAQQLGFTLKEVRELMALGEGHCHEVQELAKHKLGLVEERLADLQNMRSALQELLSQCETNAEDAHCAIIDTLGKT
ncbi:MAG TPA: Hg(II)-responsive transcriptional regulator [Gammaproteobacteria bacterium]|nr:Hg(II)-responsive transcriptional regulator [Gammaproteobacteria bacterium]